MSITSIPIAHAAGSHNSVGPVLLARLVNQQIPHPHLFSRPSRALNLDAVSCGKRQAEEPVRYSLGFSVECLRTFQEPRWRSPPATSNWSRNNTPPVRRCLLRRETDNYNSSRSVLHIESWGIGLPGSPVSHQRFSLLIGLNLEWVWPPMACAWLQLLTSLSNKAESAIVSVKEKGAITFFWNLHYTQEKSADKAITDHPTPADQGHISIKFNPCSTTRTPSTLGEQELSPSQFR
ncbi:Uncharacterized protein HZ326_0848 [Fusarium oxysporum f. sp. albedinis]|nr:Uncharacterized protein HZ326_0848 [Fusarium oxysporum f. sp. albedinis]